MGRGNMRRQLIESVAKSPGAIKGQGQHELSPGLIGLHGDGLAGDVDRALGAHHLIGQQSQVEGDVEGIGAVRAVPVGESGRGADIPVFFTDAASNSIWRALCQGKVN